MEEERKRRRRPTTRNTRAVKVVTALLIIPIVKGGVNCLTYSFGIRHVIRVVKRGLLSFLFLLSCKAI